ncbi:MAG: hypothetical protein ACI9VR_002648 [Cognaticolwellia sp.]|jgi:hypothetical protein
MLWIFIAALACAQDDGTDTDSGQDSGQVDTADTGEAGDNAVFMTALVAANRTGDQDEADQFEDWVELSNLGDAPVELGGMGLSDGYPEEQAWLMPELTLAPGDVVRIWCDEDPDDGALHADFKLAKAGEVLTLLSAQGAVLDRVSWSDLEDDQVYVRTDDGWEVE